MPSYYPSRRIRSIALFIVAFVVVIGIFLIVLVNRFVEPVLRDRLHTVIIQGSDSLYTYQLGKLDASFFGGNVEVQNLHIQINNTRYQQLAAQHALPALTMQLDLARGQIKGISVFALLFRKHINIREIVTTNADIRLLRHIPEQKVPENTMPLWKALQPSINGIAVDRIRLEGIKLLYRNADTAYSLKLQFDKCVALFNDIRIDSAASADTSRIAFAKEVAFNFNDLKFRSPDSTYKLKAETISYSSKNRVFEVSGFKLQPTLKDKESFYKAAGMQKSMQVIAFEKMRFTNLRLDLYFHKNMVLADSVFIHQLNYNSYVDKTLPPSLESKIGKYPHQHLLQAKSTIIIKAISINNAAVVYTEKSEKTGQEGQLTLSNADIRISNVTNDTHVIRRNGICTAVMQGNLLGKSPLSVSFQFFLGAPEGQFHTAGTIKNVSADQLNDLAVPLTNIRLRSFNMQQLRFDIKGDNYSALADVSMLYNNLFVVLQKKDDETGATKTKKFLTKIINKFTLHDSNPGYGGLRIAENVVYARSSSQSFFGVIWKTLFAGMQNIMMNTGRLE